MTEQWLISRRNAAARIFGMTAVAALLPQQLMAASPRNFSSTRLSVEQQGSKAPVGQDIILIAGLASGPSIWHSLAASLKGHRLHLVHIAGFAGKPAGDNAQGPLLTPLSAELKRYIASQRLRSPAIIGHSMGGTLALMLGLENDTAVGRIMVIDMLPEGAAMLGGTKAGFGYLASQLNGYFTGTKAGRQILANMVRSTPGSKDSDPHVVAKALTELAQIDLTRQLPRLKRPLSVIYASPGEPDLARAQQQRYRSAYDGIPQAAVSGIGPSGHMVMLDQPAKLFRAVQKFLG